MRHVRKRHSTLHLILDPFPTIDAPDPDYLNFFFTALEDSKGLRALTSMSHIFKQLSLLNDFRSLREASHKVILP